ncbi:MAG: hypothetical protein ABIR52_05935 [Casimicrobiaceae bacterium]
MHIVKVLAMVLGLVIAAIGVLGVAAPSVLLELGQSLQTTNALYFVAGVRVIFGAILLSVASASRTPKILRALGVFIIIAGAITPFFGVERSRAMFEWWSAQGSLFTRAWATVAIVFGLFVVYAVTSPRRAAA